MSYHLSNRKRTYKAKVSERSKPTRVSESRFTALLRKTYEEVYNDLEPEMRDRDQIIDNVLDMVDTDAPFRGRVREITRELDPHMRDADQIRDTVMEEARSELSAIADKVEAKAGGAKGSAWAPKLTRRTDSGLRVLDKSYARVNKRRASQGKRPLGGGGQVGDKPGHPFRGNQYSGG